MENKKRIIDIIYPKLKKNISKNKISSFEIFLEKIFNSKHKEISIFVNIELGFIECNDSEIKDLLYIFLKIKIINDFYLTLKEFLHDASLTCGELLIYFDNEIVKFNFKQNEHSQKKISFSLKRQ